MAAPEQKKILIVDNSLYINGSIHSTLQITSELKSEYTFVYLMPARSSVLDLVEGKGFQVLKLPMLELNRSFRASFYLFKLIINAFRLVKIIRSENIYILHVNDIYNMLGVMVKILDPQIKVVYTVRLLKTSYIKPAYSTFAYFVRKFADIIICVSQAVQKDIGAPVQSRVIYHNYIPEKLPEWAGIKDPANLNVLYLANYIPGKGQDWALRALAMVVDQYPNVSLKFVGSCNNTSDRLYRQSLIKLCEELSLQTNVDFAGQSDNIEQVIKSSDVVLNLSESESFSMVCLETISFGVPLIASDCGGPSEITDNGRQGYLVPNKGFGEAAAFLIQIIENPVRTNLNALQTKDYAKTKFNPARERQAWVEVYS